MSLSLCLTPGSASDKIWTLGLRLLHDPMANFVPNAINGISHTCIEVMYLNWLVASVDPASESRSTDYCGLGEIV